MRAKEFVTEFRRTDDEGREFMGWQEFLAIVTPAMRAWGFRPEYKSPEIMYSRRGRGQGEFYVIILQPQDDMVQYSFMTVDHDQPDMHETNFVGMSRLGAESLLDKIDDGYSASDLKRDVAEDVPQPGESSGAPKQFGPDAKIQTRQMTVKQIISSIPGVPYYNNVVDDWDAEDYSWNVTKKTIEYATYLKQHPESLAQLPPILVLNGKFEDGAHRVSAIWLLQQRMDPKNPLWANAKLNVQFVKQGVAEGANWDNEEDALVEALEEWMMMEYDDQTIKTILSSPEAEPYKDPPGGVQWLYRAIVPRDREFNSIKASGPVIAFATEMAGAITFIESLETSDDWVIIRKPFNPADFVLDFTDMYEAFVEPDNDPMSRYEVEHEVWMKAVPAYTKANKQEIVYTSKEHYGDDDWRKNDYKPKSTSKSNLRRPEDEPAIMQNPGKAYHYAKDVIKGRWPEAEPYIIQGAKSMSDSIGISILVDYARDVIGGRWPEAEPVIRKNPEYAYQYARKVIGGRWPEAEPYIRQDPVWALFYARDVIKGRWPEAEPVIMKSPRRWAEYAKLFNLDTPAQDVAENFADGKNPGRKGLAKRSGVNTKASVSSLRKTAKHSTGEKQRMAHWLANMKAGRAKARKR